jgi:hypothetical protein
MSGPEYWQVCEGQQYSTGRMPLHMPVGIRLEWSVPVDCQGIIGQGLCIWHASLSAPAGMIVGIDSPIECCECARSACITHH